MTSRNRLLRDVARTAQQDAFATFTPTLDQGGAVACSTALGRYMRTNNLVIALVNLTSSAAGTAANPVAVGGLPFNARTTEGAAVFGSFNRGLPPNPSYLLSGVWLTVNSVFLVSGAAATNYFGVNPAVTIASGDIFDLTFIYEVR